MTFESQCIYRFQNCNSGTLAVHTRQGSRGFEFYLEKTIKTVSDLSKIRMDEVNRSFVLDQLLLKKAVVILELRMDEVNCPLELDKLPFEKATRVFSEFYPQAVQLSDDTWKLYLKPRLLGGVTREELANEQRYSDAALTELIIQHIPKGLYSNVMVSSGTYKGFPGNHLNKDVPTRFITLSPFGNNAQDFFTGIWRFFAGFHPPHMTCNSTAMIDFILGINTDDQNAKKQFEDAYKEKRHIHIYMSKDGLYFHCEIEPSSKGICTVS